MNKAKTTKKTTKTSKKQNEMKKLIVNFYFYLALGALALFALVISIVPKGGEPEIEEPVKPTLVVSEEQMPGYITTDQGEVIEVDEIPTFDIVDGGQFKDIDDGLSETQGEYHDLGWAETYDVSSPEAFKNDTLNKCIYGRNYYGAQCVSLARVFWWSYADRDVSTCGTGMAKGMMNCYEENAGDDFVVYWANAKDGIQAGDWLVFDAGMYCHIGMALGSPKNGYITLLGENQGGIPCDGGGAATNIINISLNNLIGFYRPKAYIKPVPTPDAPDTGVNK